MDKEPKSRSLTIILALFLGGFGAHKFYLEQPGLGLLYLLFCLTGVPVIVSLIEIIYYLAIGKEKFESKFTR